MSKISLIVAIPALIIWCFACLSLSLNFSDDHPITVGSDGLDFSGFFANSILHHKDKPFIPRFKVEAIYQFGDSISDTGNAVLEDPTHNCALFPYGESYFNKPTGRCSDGLLMIDFFANFFELPFLDPYLKKDGNFTHGVNFAVGGATALNITTLAMKGVALHATNSSLLVQIDWFKSHLTSMCFTTSECRAKLAKALFIMGEIGGNDYFFASFERKTLKELYEMVFEIVQNIKKAIEEVIDLGALRVVVPGNFPVGCYGIYINMLKINDSNMYDELQCLKELNSFAKFHNDKLQEVIAELQKDHPQVTILYADYYSSLEEILHHATSLGFDKDTMQKSCCGGTTDGDPYDFDSYKQCGREGVAVCKEPYKHVNWDGLHFTQHSYQLMAKYLIKHVFLDMSPQPFVAL